MSLIFLCCVESTVSEIRFFLFTLFTIWTGFAKSVWKFVKIGDQIIERCFSRISLLRRIWDISTMKVFEHIIGVTKKSHQWLSKMFGRCTGVRLKTYPEWFQCFDAIGGELKLYGWTFLDLMTWNTSVVHWLFFCADVRVARYGCFQEKFKT